MAAWYDVDAAAFLARFVDGDNGLHVCANLIGKGRRRPDVLVPCKVDPASGQLKVDLVDILFERSAKQRFEQSEQARTGADFFKYWMEPRRPLHLAQMLHGLRAR